ncbi:hypothetical protein [Bradyrhizobium sp. Ec3.3]|uniref:hypothetical protein n=1 Tax=Bradyrhizobium sp. Ec3.3 TaxID=189753 RepID=UPI0012EC1129|nr:hypothetical protein [Bradyrhizobium sp. Ec3.3]
MVQLREKRLRTIPELVMARLARKIGRGHDAMYHGTRQLPCILRTGMLLPADVGDPAVFLTRSPDVAAYWADTTVGKNEEYCGGILVLNRTSLIQNYRLEPSRYPENWIDEREESIWYRCVNIRRHLLGVVRQPDQHGVYGWWYQGEQEEFLTQAQARSLHRIVSEGRAKVRNVIVQQRGHAAAVSSISGRATVG